MNSLKHKDYHQACVDIIYPAYEMLYPINQNTITTKMKKQMLLSIGEITKQRHHLNVFALELLEVCHTTQCALKQQHKRLSLDYLLNHLLNVLACLLRANNRIYIRLGKFDWIENNAGRYRDHYTSQLPHNKTF